MRKMFEMPRRLAPVLAVALAAAVAAAPAVAATGPWHETPEARVRLVSRWAAAAPGGDAGLGVEFALAPGWHVYWKNAGDAGYPPELVPAPGAPVTGVVLRYPAPERYELPGGLVAFGYEGEVVYPLDGQWAAGLDGATASLVAQLDYLVCAERCIPYRTDLALELPVAAAGGADVDPAVAPTLDAWRARLPRVAGGPGTPRVEARLVAGAGPELELLLELSAPGLTAEAPDLFFEPHKLLRIRRPQLAATAAGPGFRVPLAPVDETRPLPERLTFAWTATGLALGTGGDAVRSWEGTLELERPRTGVERGALLRAVAAVALVLAVVLALRLLRRSRPAAERIGPVDPPARPG